MGVRRTVDSMNCWDDVDGSADRINCELIRTTNQSQLATAQDNTCQTSCGFFMVSRLYVSMGSITCHTHNCKLQAHFSKKADPCSTLFAMIKTASGCMQFFMSCGAASVSLASFSDDDERAKKNGAVSCNLISGLRTCFGPVVFSVYR